MYNVRLVEAWNNQKCNRKIWRKNQEKISSPCLPKNEKPIMSCLVPIWFLTFWWHAMRCMVSFISLMRCHNHKILLSFEKKGSFHSIHFDSFVAKLLQVEKIIHFCLCIHKEDRKFLVSGYFGCWLVGWYYCNGSSMV